MPDKANPFGVTSTPGTIDNTGTFQVGLLANANRKGGMVVNCDGTATLFVFMGSVTNGNSLGDTYAVPLGPLKGLDLTFGVQQGCYDGPVSLDGTATKAFLIVECS